ncbi:hypothetical protein CVT26_007534 [Gymnopilus dilepis]|uniref:Uncharacterized protein n=1 Tax=Gymnopilus dilepis TaxID=231916 RepID=A0A409W877_9AGAR|nr:hypothetical protein CVT26_007534 [Gymnopilus dilepis]
MQEPTCTNLLIRSPEDARKILYAVKRGMLHMLEKRLDPDERMALRPGCVYVWEERSPGVDLTGLNIERFTEGRRWHGSRMKEGFLFYYEKWGEHLSRQFAARGALTSKDDMNSRVCSTTQNRPSPPSDWDQMIKQTYAAWTETERGRKKWHLTAYFSKKTVDNLDTVESLLGLRGTKVPKGIFTPARTASKASKAPRRYYGIQNAPKEFLLNSVPVFPTPLRRQNHDSGDRSSTQPTIKVPSPCESRSSPSIEVSPDEEAETAGRFTTNDVQSREYPPPNTEQLSQSGVISTQMACEPGPITPTAFSVGPREPHSLVPLPVGNIDCLVYREKYVSSGSSQYNEKNPPPGWDGLIKLTYALTIFTKEGRKRWHLNSYSSPGTRSKLDRVDESPDLCFLRTDPTWLQSPRKCKGSDKTSESGSLARPSPSPQSSEHSEDDTTNVCSRQGSPYIQTVPENSAVIGPDVLSLEDPMCSIGSICQLEQCRTDNEAVFGFPSTVCSESFLHAPSSALSYALTPIVQLPPPLQGDAAACLFTYSTLLIE